MRSKDPIEEELHYYHLSVPKVVWFDVVRVARENDCSILTVIRAAIKTFLQIYKAGKNGEAVKIGDTEIRFLF